jgi:hypothetical protein
LDSWSSVFKIPLFWNSLSCCSIVDQERCMLRLRAASSLLSQSFYVNEDKQVDQGVLGWPVGGVEDAGRSRDNIDCN